MTAQSPLYIVTYSTTLNGRRHTGTFEMDMDRMTEANVIDDILTGQFDDVRRIYECIPGGTCSDVTEDIAVKVRDRVVFEHHTPSYELVSWLHDILGVRSIAMPEEA